jgi:SAM-dependent methyltransferase
LFTSLGYFGSFKDNLKVFKNVAAALKPGGFFIVDFFNTDYVRQHMINEEIKEIDGIQFKIKKREEAGQIVKRIEFTHHLKHYAFEERVSALSRHDFENFANESNLRIVAVYGDYKLHPFDAQKSQRLILKLQK